MIRSAERADVSVQTMCSNWIHPRDAQSPQRTWPTSATSTRCQPERAAVGWQTFRDGAATDPGIDIGTSGVERELSILLEAKVSAVRRRQTRAPGRSGTGIRQ